jgi:hypothetical protein
MENNSLETITEQLLEFLRREKENKNDEDIDDEKLFFSLG